LLHEAATGSENLTDKEGNNPIAVDCSIEALPMAARAGQL